MENPFALATGFANISMARRSALCVKKMIAADRLAAFSDGIFAVALTVIVLELKAPDQSVSLNGMVCSTLPLESKMRTSPERKHARCCA
jgi:hypothetical protein